MAKMWVINVGCLRAGAQFQFALGYKERERATRVFDEIQKEALHSAALAFVGLAAAAGGRAEGPRIDCPEPVRRISDLATVVYWPGDVLMCALIEQDVNPRPEGMPESVPWPPNAEPTGPTLQGIPGGKKTN